MNHCLWMCVSLLTASNAGCSRTTPSDQNAASTPNPAAESTSKDADLSTLPHWRVHEQLWSSGQPSTAQWAAIAHAGARTVIDLRSSDEGAPSDEQAAVEAAGMRYLSLPTAGAAGITRAQAAVLAQQLAASEGPVWLHCASGNRAGALLALKAAAEGASQDEALALGRAAGMTSLEATVRTQLAAPTP